MTTVRVHAFSTVSMQSFDFSTVSDNQQQQQKSSDPSDVAADLLLLGSKREEKKLTGRRTGKKTDGGQIRSWCLGDRRRMGANTEKLK